MSPKFTVSVVEEVTNTRLGELSFSIFIGSNIYPGKLKAECDSCIENFTSYPL